MIEQKVVEIQYEGYQADSEYNKAIIEAMLDYFQDRVRDRNAHLERWRGSVPARQQAEVDATYERMIAGMEADGVHCAPLLRRVVR